MIRFGNRIGGNDGVVNVVRCDRKWHVEVTFGLLAQLVLENVPTEELETVINFIKGVGLPLTLKDLGVEE